MSLSNWQNFFFFLLIEQIESCETEREIRVTVSEFQWLFFFQ